MPFIADCKRRRAVDHYHIRWSDSKIDWQVFSASEEAQIEAEKLARPGETYRIERFGEDCPKCKAEPVRAS